MSKISGFLLLRFTTFKSMKINSLFLSKRTPDRPPLFTTYLIVLLLTSGIHTKHTIIIDYFQILEFE